MWRQWCQTFIRNIRFWLINRFTTTAFQMRIQITSVLPVRKQCVVHPTKVWVTPKFSSIRRPILYLYSWFFDFFVFFPAARGYTNNVFSISWLVEWTASWNYGSYLRTVVLLPTQALVLQAGRSSLWKQRSITTKTTVGFPLSDRFELWSGSRAAEDLSIFEWYYLASRGLQKGWWFSQIHFGENRVVFYPISSLRTSH